MITFVRSRTVQPDKIGEAMPWGKKLVGIVKRVPERTRRFARPLGAQLERQRCHGHWLNDRLQNISIKALQPATSDIGLCRPSTHDLTSANHGLSCPF